MNEHLWAKEIEKLHRAFLKVRILQQMPTKSVSLLLLSGWGLCRREGGPWKNKYERMIHLRQGM